MKKALSTLAFWMLLLGGSMAQRDFYQGYEFTQADTLRGMLRPERTCFDVTYYDLQLAIDVEKEFLKGFVDIHFRMAEPSAALQIDLYKNMKINEITMDGVPLSYKRLYDAVFVYLPKPLPAGLQTSIRVLYEGFPQVAVNAPWEGGFVWSKDRKGNHWVGVACEGEGASLWWPCKDHLGDEPDSASIRIAVPRPLVCVSNGVLRKMERLDNGFMRYDWFVSYPINTYNITLNIAKYAHFTDTYVAVDGDSLALDYYVLPMNLEKAKTHFEQVKPMLACYERYFGKYPFWRDGFAMVETPFLGMEHQSAIAYGNNYMRGYLGGMIPRDMNWDYIIIHESGHEYFGNAVSTNDHADLWIHESFTTYLEALYVECTSSYEDALRYLESQRIFINNAEPMVGPPNVNFRNWEAGDQYFKGAWVLHTLRNALDDDSKWFALLRALYDNFKYKTCSTEEVIRFINAYTGKDFTRFFEQYLYHPGTPILAHEVTQVGADVQVSFKWSADVPGFDMPVKVGKPGSYFMIYPNTEEEKTMLIPNLTKSEFTVATELFYVRKEGL